MKKLIAFYFRFIVSNLFQMYLCCLPNSTQFHPHRSETDILRSILPTGAVVNIRRFPCKRSLPYRADIFLENDEPVIDVLERLWVAFVLHFRFSKIFEQFLTFFTQTTCILCFYRNLKSIINLRRIEKRVIHPCFDLVPYKPSMYTELYKLDCNYQEDLEIFQPFAKGRLEYADL